MGLRQHLEEQLNKDYEQLKEYEDELRHEIDPALKRRWNARIEYLQQRIREREEELKSLPASSVQPEPITPKPISRKTGVDYTELRNLLAAQKWKEADEKTFKMMLIAAGEELKGLFTKKSLNKLPCEDLKIIEGLWQQYSEGHFGFKPQLQIYLRTSNAPGGAENGVALKRFADCVGWRKGERWLGYDELTFDRKEAPKGHLPHLFWSTHVAWVESTSILIQKLFS